MRTLQSAASVFYFAFYFAFQQRTLTIGRPPMHVSVFTLLLTLASLWPAPLSLIQTNKQPQQQPPLQLLTRTTRRHESTRFSYGGTVTLIGAPRGAVTVEGWNRDEVELTADIEWKAESAAGRA